MFNRIITCIKHNLNSAFAILGATLVSIGIVLATPDLPWTLIYLGGFILLVTAVDAKLFP